MWVLYCRDLERIGGLAQRFPVIRACLPPVCGYLERWTDMQGQEFLIGMQGTSQIGHEQAKIIAQRGIDAPIVDVNTCIHVLNGQADDSHDMPVSRALVHQKVVNQVAADHAILAHVTDRRYQDKSSLAGKG